MYVKQCQLDVIKWCEFYYSTLHENEIRSAFIDSVLFTAMMSEVTSDRFDVIRTWSDDPACDARMDCIRWCLRASAKSPAAIVIPPPFASAFHFSPNAVVSHSYLDRVCFSSDQSLRFLFLFIPLNVAAVLVVAVNKEAEKKNSRIN